MVYRWSQSLYGEETLKQVEKNAKKIAKGLKTKYPIVYKETVKTHAEAVAIKDANYDENCLGIIFNHILAIKNVGECLTNLQNHGVISTQFYDEIPNTRLIWLHESSSISARR